MGIEASAFTRFCTTLLCLLLKFRLTFRLNRPNYLTNLAVSVIKPSGRRLRKPKCQKYCDETADRFVSVAWNRLVWLSWYLQVRKVMEWVDSKPNFDAYVCLKPALLKHGKTIHIKSSRIASHVADLRVFSYILLLLRLHESCLLSSPACPVLSALLIYWFSRHDVIRNTKTVNKVCVSVFFVDV